MNWEIISKIIGGIFLVMIISIFNIIVYVLSEPEEHFIEAVKRTWNEKPILDISTTKIDDDYYEYPLFNLTNSNTFCDFNIFLELCTPNESNRLERASSWHAFQLVNSKHYGRTIGN